ncbi:hypothetical protein QUF88_03550 [Bacillus sp. DX1.1]|uniref:hypothetical protein n=1 Tax=unclassified Bacillus (in: firmicutes) TaxID=185979 RepID=UPI00256FF756|nr:MULTISPECIES: hypothetical protein [unclassified Bacillus (in: firmicutes)]MDM5153002.1 hypothetical protein [Bacillus sp. DX1.1]WJE81979.1 hypothetical protein QRE67_01080 [Bacillus sp. DX3.1]
MKKTPTDGSFTLFTASLSKSFPYPTPKKVDEGILDWKQISWLLSEQNHGIAPLSKKYLYTVLHDPQIYEHTAVIDNKQITQYEKKLSFYTK